MYPSYSKEGDESHQDLGSAFGESQEAASGHGNDSSLQARDDGEQLQPCLCNNHRGCCKLHESTRTPLPYRKGSDTPDINDTSDTSEVLFTPDTIDVPDATRSIPEPEQRESIPAMILQLRESLAKACRRPMRASNDEERIPLLQVDTEEPVTFEEKPLEQFIEPSVDYHPAQTLAPIHASVPYHLSLDHLDCVRRQRNLARGSSTVFIEELSDSGKLTPKIGIHYYWTNEIHYTKWGLFLQKQRVRCIMTQYQKDPVRLVSCPHRSVNISEPVFLKDAHNAYAQVQVQNYPPHCPRHECETWSSEEGDFTQLSGCSVCYSDAECHMRKYNKLVDVRYTCYRDLGSGIKADPMQTKWRPLLTGEEEVKDENRAQVRNGTFGVCMYPHTGHEFDVYIRVWNAASKLRRPDNRTLIHRTSKGPLDVLKFRLDM